MKKLLLALVLLLSSPAGTAGAAPAAPPQSPADGPDLTLMALGLTDFSGATVEAQKYSAVLPELVAAYERDLVLPHGALAYLSDEVDLYAKASAAGSDGAGLRRLLSSSGGRTHFGALFARGLKPLKTDAGGANCADIPGAAAATYVVTAADAGFTLGVRAQATNPLSTMTAESALTAPVS